MSDKALSDQHIQFCVNLIANGGNGTKAAEDAGYAHAGARVRACKLLKDARIKAKIAELTARAAAEATEQLEQAAVQTIAQQAITAEGELSLIDAAVASLKERVMKRLTSLGLTELPELATWTEDTVAFVPSEELSETARGSVQSVKAQINEVISDEGDKIFRKTTMEVKQHNPMPALRELMKLVGLQPRDEKVKGQTAVGVQVILMGGATGIEAAASSDVTSVVSLGAPIVVQDSAEEEVAAVTLPATQSVTARPWRPGPRKKNLSTVAAAARAALVTT